MLDERGLVRLLKDMGFDPEPHGDRTYRIRRASEQGEIVAYVRFAKDWLVASVVPFLPTKGRNSFELARWLLRQNRDMNQAKFAYDEDGDVVLTAELPTESLDPGEVETAIRALMDHTVEHRATLRAAARG